MRSKLPNLSHHKLLNRGYITFKRKRIYIPGKWPADQKDAPRDVHRAYLDIVHRLTDPNLEGQPVEVVTGQDKTLAVYMANYLLSIEGNKSEHTIMMCALRPLKIKLAAKPADTIQASDIEEVRRSMIAVGWTRKVRVDNKIENKRIKYTRSGLNHWLARVKKFFTAMAERGQISWDTHRRITKGVKPLRLGHRGAPEAPPKHGVSDELVDATLPNCPPQIAAMIEIQRETGMRPGEVCALTTADIDRSDSQCWFFIPERHKTAHLGKTRVIGFGPRAQKLLQPWLKEDDPEAPLFNPADRVADLLEKKREARATPVQPSQANRSKPNPKRAAGDHYTTQSYGQAIRRICQKNDLTCWTANQLRKRLAQKAFEAGTLAETADALGHSSPEVTKLHYLKLSKEKVKQAITKLG